MAANLNTVAWKGDESGDGIEYNVQISQITYKFRKPIEDAMKDWKKISYGWNLRDSTEVFIFRKTFRSEQEWVKWAQKFPLPVKEKRFWGNKDKSIIHKKVG